MKSQVQNTGKSNYGFRDIPFAPMNKQEQALVIGGDYFDDLFNLLFDTSMMPTNGPDVQLNLANAVKIDAYRHTFREIASTMVGYQLFDQMKLSGQKIVLDPTTVSNTAAEAAYNSGTNHLRIAPDVQALQSQFFVTFAHELYHAYSDIVEGNSNDWQDVKAEINANLFKTMAAIQYDKDRGLAATNIASMSYSLDDYSQPPLDDSMDIIGYMARAQFKAAWDDILIYGNFNTINYNNLVDHFLWTYVGQSYLPNFGSGGPVTLGVNLSANPVSDLSTSQSIDEFFDNNFREFYTLYYTPYTGYGGSGNGSGNGNGGSGWQSFSEFMSWVWHLQDQGSMFYTSYTITTTPGFLDINILQWISGSSQTTYNYAGMGDFFYYYMNGGTGAGWGSGGSGGGFSSNGSY